MGIQESVHVWCLVTLNKSNTLLVGLIYRSPNSTVENNDKILQPICNLQKFSHLAISTNLTLANWNDYSCPSSLSLSAKFLDAVLDTFLTQHINVLTRHRLGQNSSILDLMFTNDPAMVCNIVHLPPLGHGDHEVLLWSFVYSGNCSPSFSVTPKETCKYFHGDYEQMNNRFLSVDWEVLLQEGNTVEENWTAFKNVAISAAKMFIPT